ncbi:MAG TPA: putative glycoside hydrolase, partial [Bdellovibrionota bacterium]|nr:putative glycoside hydrolase [Bdellovibrionota bacterium]
MKVALCLALSAAIALPAQAAPGVAERIQGRSFPSVFQAWSGAENMNFGPEKPAVPLKTTEDELTTVARHDLFWTGLGAWGLGKQKYPGLALKFPKEEIARALLKRTELLSKNPHMVLLAEIRYHDAKGDYLPEQSPWWKRNPKTGQRDTKTEGSFTDGVFHLDFSNPEFRDHVAKQCRAAIQTGAVDGCMFDWWSKDTPDQVALVKKVRSAIGEDGIILVNSNGKMPQQSAPYINGLYMEGLGASWFGDWKAARDVMLWAKTHLRQPSFTALDVWHSTTAQEGRGNLQAMRMATALALVFSDGYVLYADPNTLPTPDHLHDWYGFWDRRLGKPEGPGEERTDHSFRRLFS